MHFNPRAYVRHDNGARRYGRKTEFQSTCLREARPAMVSGSTGSSDFNPRAYVRHDSANFFTGLSAGFQSTCLREARREVRMRTHRSAISIHVPT
mgnify:CR=1 FL=1